eukprot:1519-Heterococcus_DN1.PRE.1
MWRDTVMKTVPVVHPQQQQQQQQPLQTGLSPTAVRNIDSDVKFEIGKLFERYNSSKDGRLTRADFEKMVQEEYTGGDSSHSATTTAAATAQQPSPLFSSHLYVQRDNTQQHQQQQHQTQQHQTQQQQQQQQQLKAAAAGGSNQTQQQQQQQQQADGKAVADAYSYSGVQIGPALTHYNETTGVPLPNEAVTGQVSLGHTVVPLHDAYNRRLSRLQALVSSRLMPAREQLLQLRRRLHTCADEVKAAKDHIERETMADTNAILERLRSAEALKQASLGQRVNDVSAELSSLDKIAKQVAGVTALSDSNGYVPPAS